LNAASSRRRLAVALVGALVLGGSLIGASRLGTEEGAASPSEPLPSILDGIPQNGAVLGSPKAPVTLVEYADLQCPYCAEWTHRTFPTLVDRYVRQGKVRIVFHGLAFLGDDSDRALRTAVAAGRENRLWNVVESLYHRQGHENSGWVTEALLDEVAGPRAVAARNAPWVGAEMADASRAARAASIAGTPAFQIGKTGGKLQTVPLNSLGPEGLQPAIDASLAS
jgi:protein-disulfide isomerase